MPFKRLSADEAKAKLEKRKAMMRDTGSGLAIIKAMKAPPSWDETKRAARFIMSSESVDRYRDIIVQAGLEIDRFMENPTALIFHNSRSWPIGNWSDITKILNGRPRRTEGMLNFMPAGADPDADRAAIHVQAGTVRTVSIGFLPDWDEVEMILDEDDHWTGGFRYPKSELLECSLVPIPAQPDALVKDAGGDMQLAREIVEDILDNYARSPEGLLMTRDEFHARHLDVLGERSTYIVNKDLMPAASVPRADLKMVATTDEEARALIGAKVAFDPAHAENKGWPFDVLKKAEGEIFGSWIVSEGENKGVHALAVEFLTDGYSGMFRGIRAERFLLVPAKPEAEEKAEEQAAVAEAAPVPEVPTKAVEPIVIQVKADTAPLEADISRATGLLDGLAEKIAKIFGREKPADRVEPTVKAPLPVPTAEEIAAAKASAAEALAWINAK